MNKIKTFNKKKNLTQVQYEKWGYDLMKNYISKFCKSSLSPDKYAKQNGYFITMTFDKKHIQNRRKSLNISSKANTQIELENFNKFYNAACTTILGKNYNRKKSEQPFCFLFFDVEASRYRKTFDPNDIKGIHIHAIMILRQHDSALFFSWAKSYLTKLRLLESLEADAIDI